MFYEYPIEQNNIQHIEGSLNVNYIFIEILTYLVTTGVMQAVGNFVTKYVQ